MGRVVSCEQEVDLRAEGMVQMISDDIMNSIKVPTLSVNREFLARVEFSVSLSGRNSFLD